MPPAAEIKAAYDEGEVLPVELHDGSRVLLRKVAKDYDPGNRGAALEYIRARQRSGEIVTGLLYIDGSEPDMHGVNGTVAAPLARLPYEDLCPAETRSPRSRSGSAGGVGSVGAGGTDCINRPAAESPPRPHVT